MKYESRIMEKKKQRSVFFIRNSLSVIRDSEAGFTLIELLISISIIGVLSSMVMINTGASSRQKNLDRAAQQLALDIRTAQNFSLAPSDTPNCVYGLHVQSSTQYFLYRKETCPAVDGNPALLHEYDSTSLNYDRIIPNTTTTIGNGIVISTQILPSPNDLDISFEAPEPITYLQGKKNNQNVHDVPGNTVMTITLMSQDGITKNVVTNRFGQVEIQ